MIVVILSVIMWNAFMLSVVILIAIYAQHSCVECHYVVMMIVVMLSVIMLNVLMLSVAILIVMPNVVKLNVIMLL